MKYRIVKDYSFGGYRVQYQTKFLFWRTWTYVSGDGFARNLHITLQAAEKFVKKLQDAEKNYVEFKKGGWVVKEYNDEML